MGISDRAQDIKVLIDDNRLSRMCASVANNRRGLPSVGEKALLELTLLNRLLPYLTEKDLIAVECHLGDNYGLY